MPRKKKVVVKESMDGSMEEKTTEKPKRKQKKTKDVKKSGPAKPTYHKSKNNRYYKKTTVNGKCQTRFCSKKEAADAGFT